MAKCLAIIAFIIGLLKFAQDAPDLIKKVFSGGLGGGLLNGLDLKPKGVMSKIPGAIGGVANRAKGAITGAAGGAYEGLVNRTGIRAGAKLGAAAGRKAGGNQFNAQRQGVYKTYGGKGTAGIFGNQKSHEVRTDKMKKSAENYMKQQFLESNSGIRMYNQQLGEQLRAKDLKDATERNNIAVQAQKDAKTNATNAQTRLNELQATRSSLNTQLSDATSNVNSAQSALNSANTALAAAESSYSSSQRRMLDGLYAEEIKRLNGGRLDGVTNEMRAAAKANIMQRMSNNIQNGTASVEERSAYNAMQKVQQLTAARDQAASQLTTAQNALNDINNQISSTDSQIVTAQSKLDTANLELSTADAALERSKQELANINDKDNANYIVTEADTRLTDEMKTAAKNSMDDIIASTEIKNLNIDDEDDKKLASAYKSKVEEEAISRFKNSDEFRRQAAIQQEAMTRLNNATGSSGKSGSGGGSSSGGSSSGGSSGGSH